MQQLSPLAKPLFDVFATTTIDASVYVTDLAKADAIVIFGNKHHTSSMAMAKRAADLYARGYAPHIIVSGGVANGRGKIEALEIRRYLVSHGVPASAVHIDTKATNTKENIVNARRIAERFRNWPASPKIIGIGQIYASRRMAMTVAKQWPKALLMSAPISTFDRSMDEWHTSPTIMARLSSEQSKIPKYLVKGDITHIDDAAIARKIHHAKVKDKKPRPILA